MKKRDSIFPLVLEDIDGCIEHIRVKNFFCHDHFEVSLNPNVNFIVGNNGSGKSAIITALVVGFGLRASTTKRGSKINSFIKRGANSATVEIRIKNNTPNAFKPELYGDSIVIIRNITASGGSSYKLKSASGSIISTDLNEIKNLMVKHDIQVENPISILNQTEAISFHSGDPKRKYELFRRATNMSLTEENFRKAKEDCIEAANCWKITNEAFKEAEEKFYKWKNTYEQMKSREGMKTHLRTVENEFFWSKVLELEKEKKKIDYHHQCSEAKVNNTLEKITHIENKNTTHEDKVKKIKEKIISADKEKEKAETELWQSEEVMRTLHTSLSNLDMEHKSEIEKYNREQSVHVSLEKEIKVINTGEMASRRRSLMEQVQKSTDEVQDMNARHVTVSNETNQARLQALHAKRLFEDAMKRLEDHQNARKLLVNELTNLESAGGDQLALYGINMINLVRQVEEAAQKGHFSAPPRGPIGSYLKVKDEKWTNALEHILSNQIHTFCVNTNEDSQKLFKIMQSVYGNQAKPTITCSAFLDKKHDVSNNIVRAGPYMSALHYLDCPDIVVTNFLIDILGVESILLVPEHEDATSLSDNVKNVPRNCNKIVTVDSTEFYPAPNYKSYGGGNRQSKYLQVSCDDRKRQLEDEIKHNQVLMETLKTEYREAHQKDKEAAALDKEMTRQLFLLNNEKYEIVERNKKLTAQLEDFRETQLDTLIHEKTESERKLGILSEHIERNEKMLLKAKKEIETLQPKLKAIRMKIAELNNIRNHLNEDLSKEVLNKERYTTEIQSLRQYYNDQKAKFEQLGALLEEKEEEIEEHSKHALNLGPRPDNIRAQKVVEEEVKALKSRINSITMCDLSKEQVLQRFSEAHFAYQNMKQKLEFEKTMIKKADTLAKSLLTSCCVLQNLICLNVNVSYESILRVRGYVGRLVISPEDGTLELRCARDDLNTTRDDDDVDVDTSNRKGTLSGGERSYMTVAFILALWENVTLPFAFLDEFEVYMDDLNRKIIMDLLVDHALNHPTRQYVFLTPKNTTEIEKSPQITVHRMPDPRDVD